MPDASSASEAFAVQWSETGRTSRKALSNEAQAVLFDAIDTLAAQPDAFPTRTSRLGASNIQIYTHPSPPMEFTYELDRVRRVLSIYHVVMPKVKVTRPVFISYSHKDADWLDKLKQFLRPLEDKGLISVWDDTQIRPGTEWQDEIGQALDSAGVAVFLVTQNFVDSPFVRDKEMPRLLQAARDRGCLIFWITVSANTFQDSPLAKIQGANPMSQPLDLMPEPEQRQALCDIYAKLKAAVTPE